MREESPQDSEKDWDPDQHYKDEKVARSYDGERFSSIPGRVFNNLEKNIIAKAFSSLPPGSIIADIPCGTGRLAEPLLMRGYRVHGMDISGKMLAVASERLAEYGVNFTTEVADAKECITDHDRYDGVLCARVLMHFPLAEQIEFLRGAARLTTGKVLLNHSYSTPYLDIRRKLKKLLGHQESARFPVTDAEIKALLEGAGLREVRRFRLNHVISEAIYLLAEPLV